MHRLNELEQTETYVFHGSGLRLVRLEPRQAYTLIDEKKLPDGEPGIHASNFAEYAIFMAIINPENCPLGARSSCSYSGELFFSATSATLAQISERTVGYVHVLRRSDFIQRNLSEWVCYHPIEPVEIIEVKRADLTRDISIIETSQ